VKRSSRVVLALALAGIAAAGWLLFWPRASLPQNLLAVVPGDALGFVRIRVDRVLASDAYKRLIVERGGAAGVESVQARCGFNPLARISELVAFARAAPEGGVPRFAFAARAELRPEELLDCLKKFSGGDEAAIHFEEIEGIPTVRSKKGTSRAAFVGRDGVLGGDAEGVRAAIHTLLERAPSAAQDALLSGLYRDIDQGSDVALVSRVPDEAKAAIRALAPIAGPEILQLEAVRALSASATTNAGRIAGGALLVARDAAQAANFVQYARGAIDRLLALPGIGLTPVSSVLRAVQMEAQGDRATFAGAIKISTIETLLDLAPVLEQLARGAAPQRASTASIDSDGGLTDGGVAARVLEGSAADDDDGEDDDEKAARRERRRARRAAKADQEEGDRTASPSDEAVAP
jgi:hypothetical protein